MKIHRFITEFTRDGRAISIQDPSIVKQMKQVLKLVIGESFILPTQNGTDIWATIESYDNRGVHAVFVKEEKNIAEPVVYVRLYASILKREHFELVVQKATEIGVKEIIPLICERTIKLGTKTERLAIIAKEASELCGRTVVPTIHEPTKFSEAISNINDKEAHYFLDASGSIFPQTKKIDQIINLYIGPEGGWTPAERALADDMHLSIVSLGPRIFRGETACIVASYLGVGEGLRI
jgi:16S rRNA (uracil1498-N3)-methyltransferase